MSTFYKFQKLKFLSVKATRVYLRKYQFEYILPIIIEKEKRKQFSWRKESAILNETNRQSVSKNSFAILV